MDETHIEDVSPKVTTVENKILNQDFSKVEVKEAIFEMYHNLAPEPSGFPSKFYSVLCIIIKGDLMALSRISVEVFSHFIG